MASDPISRYLSVRTAKLSRYERMRPMSSPEALEVALRIYQNLGWTFLRLTALPSFFCLAATTFTLYYFMPAMFETSKPGDQLGQIGEVIITLALMLFAAGPLFLIGLSMSTVVVTQLASDWMRGQEPDTSHATRSMREMFTSVLAINFRQLFVACGGLILSAGLLVLSSFLDSIAPNTDWAAGGVLGIGIIGVVVGSVFFLYSITVFALAPVLVVLERIKGKEAAKRSKFLLGQVSIGTGSNTIWGLYLILFFIWLALYAGFSAGIAMIDPAAAIRTSGFAPWIGALLTKGLEVLPWFISIWFLIPFWATTLTVIYYERRIRLEGFDIVELARDVWRSNRKARFEL